MTSVASEIRTAIFVILDMEQHCQIGLWIAMSYPVRL